MDKKFSRVLSFLKENGQDSYRVRRALKKADKARKQKVAMDAPGGKEDTGWRTTETGKHYHIGEGGKVDKGPAAMKGSNINDPSTWNNSGKGWGGSSGGSKKKSGKLETSKTITGKPIVRSEKQREIEKKMGNAKNPSEYENLKKEHEAETARLWSEYNGGTQKKEHPVSNENKEKINKLLTEMQNEVKKAPNESAAKQTQENYEKVIKSLQNGEIELSNENKKLAENPDHMKEAPVGSTVTFDDPHGGKETFKKDENGFWISKNGMYRSEELAEQSKWTGVEIKYPKQKKAHPVNITEEQSKALREAHGPYGIPEKFDSPEEEKEFYADAVKRAKKDVEYVEQLIKEGDSEKSYSDLRYDLWECKNDYNKLNKAYQEVYGESPESEQISQMKKVAPETAEEKFKRISGNGKDFEKNILAFRSSLGSGDQRKNLKFIDSDGNEVNVIHNPESDTWSFRINGEKLPELPLDDVAQNLAQEAYRNKNMLKTLEWEENPYEGPYDRADYLTNPEEAFAEELEASHDPFWQQSIHNEVSKKAHPGASYDKPFYVSSETDLDDVPDGSMVTVDDLDFKYDSFRRMWNAQTEDPDLADLSLSSGQLWESGGLVGIEVRPPKSSNLKKAHPFSEPEEFESGTQDVTRLMHLNSDQVSQALIDAEEGAILDYYDGEGTHQLEKIGPYDWYDPTTQKRVGIEDLDLDDIAASGGYITPPGYDESDPFWQHNIPNEVAKKSHPTNNEEKEFAKKQRLYNQIQRLEKAHQKYIEWQTKHSGDYTRTNPHQSSQRRYEDLVREWERNYGHGIIL